MGIKISASHTARVEMIDGKEAVDERFEFMALPKRVPLCLWDRLGICPTRGLHLYHRVI